MSVKKLIVEILMYGTIFGAMVFVARWVERRNADDTIAAVRNVVRQELDKTVADIPEYGARVHLTIDEKGK